MRTAHRQAARGKRRWQADAASLGRVMARTQPYTDAEQAELQIPVYDAFDALRTGKGQQDHVDRLAIIANACMIVGEEIDPRCVSIAQDAQQAILRCRARFKITGRYALDGLGLQAMIDLTDYHDQLLRLVTPQQMTRAYQIMRERNDRGEVIEGFEVDA